MPSGRIDPRQVQVRPADADVWGEGVKPHGRDCPDRCSQCIGAPVQRITIDVAELLIDGKPAGRELDKEQGVQTYYQRRGGKR